MGYIMRYAEVSVNSPIAQRRTFSAVWVPFGNKTLQGIVLELSPYPAIEETRDIIDVIEPELVLSPVHLSLARWISNYYLSPLFDAVALMLPPGFQRQAVTFVEVPPTAEGHDTSSLPEEQKQTLVLVHQQGKISLKELEKKLGKKRTQSIVASLVRRGLLVRSYETEPIKVRVKQEPYLRLSVPINIALTEASMLRQQRANKQADLIEFLSRQAGAVTLKEARNITGCSSSIVKSLVSKGLIDIEQVEVRRQPTFCQGITPSSPLKLTTAQESAFMSIRDALHKPQEGPHPFLLHGVTGSGKTEVYLQAYLQALAEAVRQGKRGIVLVPEIALTPQTIERFASRFPGKVAVLHSQLSLGERFDEWRRIRNGEFDVVVGPRSAIFAPQPELGLIIIDEEHEWTYKQTDRSPHYHTRTVTTKLAELTGATVILGSATPDVETFYHARRGDYHLLHLPERVVPTEGASLPGVEVVDMREELKAGNRSIFSRSLDQAITRTLAGSEQAILFLNRRGGATFIQCRNCGLVLRCRSCETALSYHTTENVLICHQCNHKTPLPRTCPRCLSHKMKLLGIGTQKLEQEAGDAFPEARKLRWDSDVTRSKHSHQEILSRFRSRQADILIGTQMVAKGLDLPAVTLVGVISADTSLNLPDFRAGEKTFQLLSQVAGRAGRGSLGGKVIIQTFAPEHYAIQAAARHDYLSFYEQEIAYRRQLHNPPFTRLALLVYSHTNNALCQREAERMRKVLIQERDTKGIGNVSLIGPAPAFIPRLRGRFRWQIILRGSELSPFLSTIPFPAGWTIDIDPVSTI